LLDRRLGFRNRAGRVVFGAAAGGLRINRAKADKKYHQRDPSAARSFPFMVFFWHFSLPSRAQHNRLFDWKRACFSRVNAEYRLMRPSLP
jgi:hypothetical protein